MKSDNDLIRRSDALKAIDQVGGANGSFRDVLLKAMIYAMIQTNVKAAEPRVLTCEEAKANAYEYKYMPDSCRPVFVEFRSKHERYSEEFCPPWRLGPNQRALLEHDDYGKGFRFWDDRPTPALMESTPWEE